MKNTIGFNMEGYIFLISTLVTGAGIVIGSQNQLLGAVIASLGFLGLITTIVMNALEKETKVKKAAGITIKVLLTLFLAIIAYIFLIVLA